MRKSLRPGRLAFLLVLLAAGLAGLAWTTVPHEGPALPPRAPRPSPLAPPPSGSLQEMLAHPDIIPTHHHPLLGRQAPACELADPEGKVWNLGDLLDDGPVVLIFYYGHQCIHCVRHLSEANRDSPLFQKVGARVVAISTDPAELTRRMFEQHGPFGFPVLSDPGNKVAEAYGVFKRTENGKTAGIRRHGTFVIDRDGTVQWVNVGDAPFRRTPALLYQLAKLGGTLP